MDIVIGSGPAGISVATALLDRGCSVTMVDGGKALSSAARTRKSRISGVDPIAWTKNQIADWCEPQFQAPPDTIMRYGSNHSQIPGADTFETKPEGFAFRASHAVGGFSSVWGSAVLPHRQEDIHNWPISSSDKVALPRGR